MVTLETLSIVFTGLSVSLAAFYYISTLRNTNKTQQMQLETRQAQLFMQLYNRLDKDFSRSFFTVLKWEWTDYDDYLKKYGWKNNVEAHLEWEYLCDYLEGMGVLVREEYINIHLVALLNSAMIRSIWEKFSPIILETRKRDNWPRYMIEYEYLHNALIEYSQKYPELQINPERKT